MAAKKTSIREADPSSKVQPPSKARSNSRAKPKTKSRTTSGAKTAASAMPKSAPANGVKSAKKEGKSPAHRSAPRPAQRDVPTEQLILDAARQVFHRSGMDGARMQEIAEEAGLNQALLHYYSAIRRICSLLYLRRIFRRCLTGRPGNFKRVRRSLT